jgi:hypothetical protein
VGDEPGDKAFDYGSPAAVVGGEVSLAPSAARFDEFGVVLADVDRAAVFDGGASVA